MKLPVYNINGEQVKDIELSKRLFGVVVKPEVIHQVVVAQEANSRQVLAHTKTRAEVRGGGKKPWRQKGTGRARHGSIRSPIWIGGGITFGPRKDRNFSLKVNKKQKQLALAMCLSDKVASKALTIFDVISFESGKTKDLNSWIKSIKSKIESLKNSKKFLLITEAKNNSLIKASKNLKNITTIGYNSINCVDLLKYDTVLLSEKAALAIEKHFIKVREKKENKK